MSSDGQAPVIFMPNEKPMADLLLSGIAGRKYRISGVAQLPDGSQAEMKMGLRSLVKNETQYTNVDSDSFSTGDYELILLSDLPEGQTVLTILASDIEDDSLYDKVVQRILIRAAAPYTTLLRFENHSHQLIPGLVCLLTFYRHRGEPINLHATHTAMGLRLNNNLPAASTAHSCDVKIIGDDRFNWKVIQHLTACQEEDRAIINDPSQPLPERLALKQRFVEGAQVIDSRTVRFTFGDRDVPIYAQQKADGSYIYLAKNYLTELGGRFPQQVLIRLGLPLLGAATKQIGPGQDDSNSQEQDNQGGRHEDEKTPGSDDPSSRRLSETTDFVVRILPTNDKSEVLSKVSSIPPEDFNNKAPREVNSVALPIGSENWALPFSIAYAGGYGTLRVKLRAFVQYEGSAGSGFIDPQTLVNLGLSLDGYRTIDTKMDSGNAFVEFEDLKLSKNNPVSFLLRLANPAVFAQGFRLGVRGTDILRPSKGDSFFVSVYANMVLRTGVDDPKHRLVYTEDGNVDSLRAIATYRVTVDGLPADS